MIYLKIQLVILLNVALSLSKENVTTKNGGTSDWALELVAIVFRHGVRTPLKTWPTDVYGHRKYWPTGWEQLLPKGEQQLYTLGKTLRKRYKSLISRYSPLAVRVNSSDHDRCHTSAAALAAGWFPPQADQNWTQELNWQPVPINSLLTSRDTVIAQLVPCPKYALETARMKKEEITNTTIEDESLLEYFTEHMGEQITHVQHLGPIYETLTIEDINGYELPDWTKSVYPKKLNERVRQAFKIYTWTKYQQRMMGGPMLKEILHQFKLKTDGRSSSKKVFIYAGHDTNVYNVLRALQFKDLTLVDFGAALMFELHKSLNNDYFVKLLYMNNTQMTDPFEMNIPECPNPCSLTRLNDVTEYMTAVDWDEDCKLDS